MSELIKSNTKRIRAAALTSPPRTAAHKALCGQMIDVNTNHWK